MEGRVRRHPEGQPQEGDCLTWWPVGKRKRVRQPPRVFAAPRFTSTGDVPHEAIHSDVSDKDNPVSIDLSRELLRPYDEPVMSNIRRADYVEAIVAMTLRSAGWSRNSSWSSWDFQHGESGCRMEVKQSAARQRWGRSKPARFDIAPRTGFWDEYDEWHDEPGRHAHVYVFAWHPDAEPSADQREPMNWLFYVVLERDLPDQKSIGLNWIRARATPCQADELRAALDHAIAAMAGD